MKRWAIASSLFAAACASGGKSPHDDRPPTETRTSSVAPVSRVTPDLFEAQLVDVEPGDLPLILKRPSARAVLVNVWATWCDPCVEEFPDLMRIAREYRAKGLDTVFISSDFGAARDKAKAFLEDQKVDFTSYFKVGDDMAFIETLHKEWSGALPATFVFGAQGNLQFFREGPVTYEMLKEILDNVISEEARR